MLDPFCGTATLLIERYRRKKAAHLYGVDIFGEAIEGARENAGKIVKHFDNTLNCKVMTKQESEIELNYLTAITFNKGNGVYTVEYNPHSDLSVLPNSKNLFSSIQ